MDLFAKLLLITHVIAGFTCLTTGLLAIVLRKGGRGHAITGQVFFWSMVYVNVSAILHILTVRFIPFLLVVAIFSFYHIFTGYRVLFRKKPGEQTWFDWAGALISVVAGLGLIAYGFTMLSKSLPLFIMCAAFGTATFYWAARDIRWFLKPELLTDKMWWFYHHMSAMIGAYIAAVTAFTVNAGSEIIASTSWGWLLWFLPAVILGTLSGVWKRRYKRQFAGAKERRRPQVEPQPVVTPAEMAV